MKAPTTMISGLLAAAVVVAGCATQEAKRTGRTTWDQDERDGIKSSHRHTAITSATASAPPQEQPRSISLEIPLELQYEPEQEEDISARIELSLLRFTTEQRTAATGPRARKRWPGTVIRVWQHYLTELDQDLARARSEELERRVLIQARVGTEAEYESNVQRFGPPPRALTKALKQVHARIHRHMRTIAKNGGESKRRAPRELAIRWPVAPVMITSAFGYRQDPMTNGIRFHAGSDLGADRGDVVFAAAPGRVIMEGWMGAYGYAILVQHASGYQTVYGHLDKILIVHGAIVDAGTPIGLVGSSGRSTGPHLHFEVRLNGKPMDPVEAIGTALPRVASLEKRGKRPAAGGPDVRAKKKTKKNR